MSYSKPCREDVAEFVSKCHLCQVLLESECPDDLKNMAVNELFLHSEAVLGEQ